MDLLDQIENLSDEDAKILLDKDDKIQQVEYLKKIIV